MITQTNFQGSDVDLADTKSEMSPQTIHAPSFEDDEFDINQVALPVGALVAGDDKRRLCEEQQQLMGHFQQPYTEYYSGQEQWLGEYQNHQLSYNYSQAGYGQQQYQQQQYQPMYQMYPAREDMYQMAALPPGRSPSGSHSTPSPHSQECGEDGGPGSHHQTTIHHPLSELKRPHADAFRHDSLTLASQNPVKKPKVSRRKKKRDPNEPQKPVSAYALFFRDSQASIKGRTPNMSFGDVSKCVASMWDNLDAESKAMYKKRTEHAKKEYLRQLASYRATLVSNGQADEIYGGFPGYGYPSLGLGQNIPPHPPGPPPPHQAVYMNSSRDYQQHQANNAAAHGGPADMCRGPPHTSPEPGSPDGAPPFHGPPDSYPEAPYQRGGPAYDSFQPPHDRNHNSPGYSPGGRVPGQCGRPGCHNPVTKATDGTESTYCSSECVVGQCREVYSSWSTHHNPTNPGPTPPLPAQVK